LDSSKKLKHKKNLKLALKRKKQIENSDISAKSPDLIQLLLKWLIDYHTLSVEPTLHNTNRNISRENERAV
jgi:hypothetical protein